MEKLLEYVEKYTSYEDDANFFEYALEAIIDQLKFRSNYTDHSSIEGLFIQIIEDYENNS